MNEEEILFHKKDEVIRPWVCSIFCPNLRKDFTASVLLT